MLKKAAFFITLIFILFLCGLFLSKFFSYPQTNQIKIIPSPTPIATPDPGLMPVTLVIPKLKIETKIEAVGVNDKNQMDTPQDANDVAWYIGGPRPSEPGSAVIAGHLDTPSGRPAIFYNLSKLEPGDKVEVISLNQKKKIFIVTGKEVVPYESYPAEMLFAQSSGKNLNLITCAGIWNPEKKLYSDRMIVYTVLENSL